MTLNRWFVDYLYIPLGGSRRGKWRTVRNKLIVFFCTGLWHGAGWTYILWGLWHGVLVSGEGLFESADRKAPKARRAVVMHVYTLLAVILGFAMFRASSVQQGFLLIGRMFSFAGAGAAGLLPQEEILDRRAYCGARWRHRPLPSGHPALTAAVYRPRAGRSSGTFLRCSALLAAIRPLRAGASRRSFTSSSKGRAADDMKKTLSLIFTVLFLAVCLVPGLGLLLTGGADAAANEILPAAPVIAADGDFNPIFSRKRRTM